MRAFEDEPTERLKQQKLRYISDVIESITKEDVALIIYADSVALTILFPPTGAGPLEVPKQLGASSIGTSSGAPVP